MTAAKKNLFGHVLYNYLKGDKTPYAIVRDDGFREFPEDPGVYFKPRLYKVERNGLKYVRGRVLDVGCGAGRHALYFQERGCKVVGIDSDPLCVKTAKERGVRTVFTENIFHPKQIRKYTFDTVWFGGNNLGVAGRPANLLRLFRILDSITTPTAVVLATGFEVERTTNPDHLAYHKRQRKRGLSPGQMKLRIEYKKAVSPWFPWLHVSTQMLKEILQETPWRIERLHRSRDGHYLAVIGKRGSR